VKLHWLCCARRTCVALSAHVFARPSCRLSPPGYWRQSTSGAGRTEGKIEGDGTERRPEPYLHKGGRGTRRRMRRAASNLASAPMLAKPRAVFAPVPLAAMELSA
jgi:hypothetical protein